MMFELLFCIQTLDEPDDYKNSFYPKSGLYHFLLIPKNYKNVYKMS